MARLKKKNNIQGFIEGKSHYTMNGKDYIKNSSAPDRERLKNDPAYASVRTNFNLFGSLSTTVSVFRNALKPRFQGAMRNRIHGSLISLFQSMIADGKAVLNLRQHKIVLRSYLFRADYFFNGIAEHIPYEIECTEDRSVIQLRLKAFKHKRTKKDKNHTHYRMTLGVLLFADCIRTEAVDSVKYIPIEHAGHGTLLVAESPHTDICKLEEEQVVSVAIPRDGQHEQISQVVVLHLCFYEEVNGVMYEYGDEVMKVVEVF